MVIFCFIRELSPNSPRLAAPVRCSTASRNALDGQDGDTQLCIVDMVTHEVRRYRHRTDLDPERLDVLQNFVTVRQLIERVDRRDDPPDHATGVLGRISLDVVEDFP